MEGTIMSDVASTGYWSGDNPFHAMSAPLSDWILEYLKSDLNKQIYDFGCGRGMYLAKLRDAGFTNLCGFEGDPPNNKVFDKILKQDLTKPIDLVEKGTVISLEVAEHIPAQFTEQYLTNIYNACEANGKFICSWAIRGQGGLGHVNELNNDEAIALITAKGFRYLEEDSVDARKNILTSENIVEGHLPWFKNTVLIFERNG
jgi:SAM-dependent methyltransferase